LAHYERIWIRTFQKYIYFSQHLQIRFFSAASKTSNFHDFFQWSPPVCRKLNFLGYCVSRAKLMYKKKLSLPEWKNVIFKSKKWHSHSLKKNSRFSQKCRVFIINPDFWKWWSFWKIWNFYQTFSFLQNHCLLENHGFKKKLI
jgi:hypothetical protein